MLCFDCAPPPIFLCYQNNSNFRRDWEGKQKLTICYNWLQLEETIKKRWEDDYRFRKMMVILANDTCFRKQESSRFKYELVHASLADKLACAWCLCELIVCAAWCLICGHKHCIYCSGSRSVHTSQPTMNSGMRSPDGRETVMRWRLSKKWIISTRKQI